jgi:hypothetical protein
MRSGFFYFKNVNSFQLILPPQAALGMEAASFLLPLSGVLVWGNIAIVKLGDNFGIINKKGEYVVNPQYEYIEDFLLDELKSSSRLFVHRYD